MPITIIRLISLTAVLFVLTFLLGHPEDKNQDYAGTETAAVENAEAVQEPPALSAKAACVFDSFKNEFLFEKELQTQVPLASLTKLMTALAAEENLLPETSIEISKRALMQEGDSGLAVGERWPLKVITNIMLISSSNDAAFAIAESIKNSGEENAESFVRLMNNTAKKLGLQQTFFLNPTGLDMTENLAGAYGSCQDITKLVNYILENHPDILEITGQESYEAGGRRFKNTDKILDKIPVFLGGKTGFSDLAGGNLTVAVNKGLHHPIIITVLGSTSEDRFKDVEILYNNFTK